MKAKKQEGVGFLIEKHLKENGIMKTWLANQMNISGGYLTNMLKGKYNKLPDSYLAQINEILNTKF